MRILGLVLLLSACADPTLKLRFRVTSSHEAACLDPQDRQVTSCSEVAMACRSAVSIRVFDPNDPASPYITVCKELSTQNLCSIAAIDLPQPATKVDAQTLAIEMAVYPSAKLSTDATTGQLICPSDVTFDALGFPEASIQPCDAATGTCAPTPAIGGIAFYHPGDSETVVDLGCVDLAQLNDISCTGGVAVTIRASVDDFDTEVSVGSALADQLTVAVGEPKPITLSTGDTHFQLNSVGLAPLVRATGQSVPGWNGTLIRELATLCATVLEDAAGSTTSVRCKLIPSGTYAVEHPTIDTDGTRLSKPTLDRILAALGETAFPTTGLVVGVVLDANGNPVPNLQISASQGSVRYLTADRSGLTTKTSSNGIFVSQDALFGATFTASSGGLTATGLGGVIDGRVTIVILQFEPPTGQ